MRTYWLSLCLLLAAVALQAQDRVVLRRIDIAGTQKTKDPVILREFTCHLGDTLDTTRVAELRTVAERNIYNLGLFNRVDISQRISGDSLFWEVKVIERWYVIPEPYLTLEERTFNEWWVDKDLDRLVYGLGLNWANFTGWNDALYVYLQGGYSRRINFSYSRPFLIPRWRVDGTMGFRYLNNKEVAYGTEKGYLLLARLTDKPIRRTYQGFFTLSKRFSPRKYLHLTTDYQVFDPHDSIFVFNPNYLTTTTGSEQYPSVQLSWVNDQRDVFTFPLSGYRITALVRQSGLPGIGTTRFTKAGFTFAWHIPLSKRWNLAFGTDNQVMLGRRVPYFDKLFIGTRAFVRGYEAYVVDGSAYTVNKMELKFAIFPRRIIHVKQIPFRKFQDFPLGVYLSAFADSGIMHDGTFNNTDQTLKDMPLVGFGAGINIISMYDWLLRVEVSRNQFNQTGIFLSSLLPIR